MSKTSKILWAIAGLILLIGIMLFTPYPVLGIPEWKLQILDANGRPAAGAEIQQEWINPESEGQTPGATQTVNSDGFVVFAKHRLYNRLANLQRFTASAHVYVC